MSFLHSLSPIPSLRAYTGPYTVGTEDFEVPVSELSPSIPQLPPDSNLSTISFRIFYPCVEGRQTQKKAVYWLPEPQDEYFQAYARFMQASPWLARFLRYATSPSRLYNRADMSTTAMSLLFERSFTQKSRPNLPLRSYLCLLPIYLQDGP